MEEEKPADPIIHDLKVLSREVELSRLGRISVILDSFKCLKVIFLVLITLLTSYE